MSRIQEKLRSVTLDDKYTIESGSILINGIQCLARLPMLQKQLDIKSGLNTAGFISGYRGSPIGNLDQTLWHISDKLADNNIVFQPGVNEDLAATAVAGSQQLSSLPDATCDGVFALWYGKGPGVDRSMDAFKHGNYAGVQPQGGVLLAYGDDHPGKSSTVAHQSEQALAAQLIPSLYPSSVHEILRFGLLGWAISRYSGSWVGLKCINETIEQTATCSINPESFAITVPLSTYTPEFGVHYRGVIADRILNEQIAYEYRLARVQEFVRANNLDSVFFKSDQSRLGIVSAGKSHNDVLHALRQLGINRENAARYGLSVYKVGCIWPLEPDNALAFAADLEELLVVEEKKPFIEQQLASLLVNEKDRPLLFGKYGPNGSRLLSSTDQLAPHQIALVIATRLEALNLSDEHIRQRVAQLQQLNSKVDFGSDIRSPFFCAGCPHNRSTKIPQDSHAMVGTGCATMEVFFRPERIVPTQMGGEGANWIGLAPFVGTRHIFQNMGDGTYYHSGLMSIRAAAAANVNITFKILYNDAVAMTGGQPVDGPISVATITQQVLSEGVNRCVVVTDDESKYRGAKNLAEGVDVFHRDELDAIQRELRETAGCTVLIYEQTCAAEKRRRRKKGTFPDPAKRLFIYDAVCEGCGDCSNQANCVSIQPLETALGRKRKIDQYSCNKDYSCTLGFCPSFVTVYGGAPRKRSGPLIAQSAFESIPIPDVARHEGHSYNVMIAGIGGTGVVTIGAILGMAAHLDKRACSVFDMTGLAQKNGAVYSHLKVASSNQDITTSGISIADADLILGFDLIAASGKESMQTVAPEKTQIVGNNHIEPLAKFQLDSDAVPKREITIATIRKRIGADRAHLIDATKFAVELCGDSMAGNMLLLGYAAQQGLLPVSLAGIKRAIELNGVAVALSYKAFDLGRLAAHDPQRLQTALSQVSNSSEETPLTLGEVIDHRCKLLSKYQNTIYALRYRKTVEKVTEAEQKRAPGCNGLAVAVAAAYAKLLMYKDEYEIARLYTRPGFLRKIKDEFEGDVRLAFNLAPPVISRTDPQTGRPTKREFGAWLLPLFHILARLRWLRGTPFDVFGYSEERQRERQLISDYEGQLEAIMTALTPANHQLAVALAELPLQIRGFGHVKLKNIEATAHKAQELSREFMAIQ